MSVTKIGSNVQTLSGVSTYNGPTSVSVGTLLVNGSLANTAVTVAGGAFLGGSGTIGVTNNAQTINGGGSVTVSAGASTVDAGRDRPQHG